MSRGLIVAGSSRTAAVEPSTNLRHPDMPLGPEARIGRCPAIEALARVPGQALCRMRSMVQSEPSVEQQTHEIAIGFCFRDADVSENAPIPAHRIAQPFREEGPQGGVAHASRAREV